MQIANRINSLRRRLRKLAGLPQDLEEQIYQSLVRTGDTVFDIGANIGSVALFLSKLAGSNGKVIAFEPLWPAYEKLCRSVRKCARHNAPITPVPVGVSDFTGDREINVPDDWYGYGSLASADQWQAMHPGKKINSYECSFVTLDAFMKSKRLPQPDFMKVDVEGAELFVLRGAHQLLAFDRHPIMLLEVFAPFEKALGYAPWKVFSLLSSYRYSFLFVCPNGLTAHIPSEDNLYPPGFENGYNVIAYDPSLHADRIKAVNHLRAGQTRGMLPMAPPCQPNVTI